ncbi:hypothetical protein [Clostridium beijerinckii]|uniref:hypothetical protein n=1 Tax=Clostridium beijerinckii TaxID=1520 RepID=UPI001494114F|nr:hypothetical protein [Clostridium beijerinckii]NOW02444.1 hypothetical protein [Clostridium beijerinckii]NYC05566.1 hypothetical protein [Clostridium beijerinckii]
MFNQYPICDSDLIVKLCKCKKDNELFKKYEKINFSDAVYQEIEYNSKLLPNKTIDLNKAFTYALSLVNENREKGNVNIINLYDQENDAVKIIKKYLRAENIIYDDTNKKYVLEKNLGERVSIIYASVLGISIILSDDGDSRDFAKKFLRITIINLKDVLAKFGLNKEDILINTFIANSGQSERAYETMEEYRKTGGTKSFVNMDILSQYKKYIRNK